MYVINEKLLEEVLADVLPSVCEELLREFAIFQRRPVIYVSRCKLPLYDFSNFIDYEMQLESVEPAHRTLPLGSPSFRCLVHVYSLDMAFVYEYSKRYISFTFIFLKNVHLHHYENALWFRILLECRWSTDE